MDGKNQKDGKNIKPPVRLSGSQDSVLDASLEPTMVEPVDPLVGKNIGRYQVLAHVAKGGTGTVYRALDTVLNREVALKILHEHLESKKEVVERFRKEAMLIAQLRHPNILTVYDFLDHQGRAVLIVEYMPGFTLSSLIKETPKIPEDFVFMITLEILHGLKAAHEKGITHRDIKPANILLHPELGVKISDFGLAKITAHDDGLTKEGIFVGTPSFSSPEQIEGKPIDHRSDIFSLGLTLYILATRSHAFKQKGDSTTTVWFKIVKGKFNAVRNMDPTLSPDLDRILNRALQVPLAARYQSAQEMIDDVEKVLKARGLIPYAQKLKEFLRAPKQPYKSTFVHKNKSRALPIFFLILFFAAFAGGLFWYFKKTTVPVESAKKETPSAESPPAIVAPEPEVEKETVPVESPKVESPKVESPKPATPAPKPKIIKDIPIPEAFSLPARAEVILANPKSNPGLRWSWADKADFVLAKDAQYKNVVAKSPEPTTLKEIKSLSPGDYFWKAGKVSGGLKLLTIDSYKQKLSISRRPVVVLSRFDDVDLEINPYLQELKLDWTAGPHANSYKLEVASDNQFKSLLFSGVVLSKSQLLPRVWDKSQPVFWRVSYLDDRGNVFLIDPIRKINLKVQGHANYFDILSPKANELISGTEVSVRLAAPANAKARCAVIDQGSGLGKWIEAQRAETQLRLKVPATSQSQFLICEFSGSSSVPSYFLIPVRQP